ncbi:DUF2147 domain-containing protein [Hyphococcus luteus]|uniref:DUF2147 domain-containing protein n=1 Tax=Hyphococcus luteus TaxID=2058213 RepID=A0A2S7K698_9PROT|nr:DUF2147 domain-containing protein [Marinicaulis flavus]PQA88001.1 DUF2147 domain-containing protein [Marinicaulis flavus]
MRRFAALSIAVSMVPAGPAGANGLAAIAGDWRTVRHGAEVRITDCGDGSPCGFLVSVDDEISGGRSRDENNRDPALRGRPLDGLPILWGYSRNEDGWRDGRLYNPETGQTFRSAMDLVARDRLRVKGCLGPFCRTQVWTRIADSEAAPNKEETNE